MTSVTFLRRRRGAVCIFWWCRIGRCAEFRGRGCRTSIWNCTNRIFNATLRFVCRLFLYIWLFYRRFLWFTLFARWRAASRCAFCCSIRCATQLLTLHIFFMTFAAHSFQWVVTKETAPHFTNTRRWVLLHFQNKSIRLLKRCLDFDVSINGAAHSSFRRQFGILPCRLVTMVVRMTLENCVRTLHLTSFDNSNEQHICEWDWF